MRWGPAALAAALLGAPPALLAAESVTAASPPEAAASAPRDDAAARPAADAADERSRRAAARAARRAPMRAHWRLEIQAPRGLDSLLSEYLDVARFRSAAGDETVTMAELSRLVAVAPAQARSLLETQGYFRSQVNARLLPPSAADGAASEAALPTVRIEVDPGPQTRVRDLRFEVQGDLQQRAQAGHDPARALLESVRKDWPLGPGRPFRQEDWESAKTQTLTRMRSDAYPLANWAGTSARIDPEASAADLFLVADSGPRFRFGPLQIEGLSRYNRSAVVNLAPFSAGDPYSEADLLDYQERLAKSGLFDGVSVLVEPDARTAEAAPVHVRLRELPMQRATVGVGVSADTGPRVSLEHLHRRVFGLNWQATTRIELGRDKRLLSSDFVSHPKPGGYRNLLSGLVSREITGGVTVDSQRLRAGRLQDEDRIRRLYYLEWQDATTHTDSAEASAGALTGNYEWAWHSLDNELLPTRGLTLSAKLGAGRSFAVSGGGRDTGGWFSRATGRATLYRPLGNWFSQTRLELGQVFAREEVGVPYTLLFRAGGEQSVRGYAYQSLGPGVDEFGRAVGGRVLATGSIEFAHPISSRFPDWLGAVFVDAGNAAPRWSDFSPVWGYGIGARWRSPVGPLSLDLAYGQEVHEFRVHFNVGVTF